MNTDKNIHLIASAHLDPIWLWRWQEGCSEVLQTFSAAADRLEEYDDFIFTCSSAAYYAWVEEIEPELFKRIAGFIKEGRWVPVNGWWVQPDCNIPSGESFARQALYSQLYYYEKFGRICRTGYNVDSFGHNGMLPQLLREGGMNAYVFMRPEHHENPNAPEDTFRWRSADGSEVLTHRISHGYGCDSPNLLNKVDFYNNRINDTGYGLMLFYGTGNHGGGATRYDINLLLENMRREGYHDLEFSSPDRYFESIIKSKIELPTWEDDLQHHASGCYSVTSEVKKLNRYAETVLANAEKFDTVMTLTDENGDLKPSTEDFKKAWKDVLFNQFHDILCGCSIMEAYDDVRESEGHATTIAARALNRACLRISRRIDTWVDGVSDPVCPELRHDNRPPTFPRPLVVFNPMSWDVTMPVQIYHPSLIVRDSEGKDVPFQNVRSSRSNDNHSDTLFLATVPAFGYATYWFWHMTDHPVEGSVSSDVKVDSLSLENEYMRAEFDQNGFISALINKENGFNILSAPHKLTVIDDEASDTWAHNIFHFDKVKGYMSCESIKVVEEGPARGLIRAKYRYNDSTLSCDYILGSKQKVLEVKCKAFWRENHTMLKVAFPVSGSDPVSTYDIPCGWIKRPCNGEEEPGQMWGDITLTTENGRNGISLTSDSKYSYDVTEGEIRMALLRNAIFADHYSHRPEADFNYTDEGLSRFSYGIYLHSGEAECSDIVKQATQFQPNNRPFSVYASYHHSKGDPQKKGFFSVDADNVIVTAFKYCEDGSGDLILRAYETHGRAVHARFDIGAAGLSVECDFGPHKIKTLRIKKDGSFSEVNFLEGITE
ncbi:MAG: alpha-mannosidase [Clostridia bacterium]|nr:alpha-mannosidase [Clostridia bacterium]